MAVVRVRDLEIDQDLRYQRRSWLVQRIGWVVMGLFIVAAALGLLGSGPLSKGTRAVDGVFSVEYPRFARYQNPETLEIRLEPAATAGGTARVWIDRQFLDSARVETVLPPPQRVDGAGDRLVYAFAMARPNEPLHVTFNFQPQRVGMTTARIGVEAAGRSAEVHFRQLVYP